MSTQRRAWDSKRKAKIVPAGLHERTVASLCHAYAIIQSMQYRWQDTVLAHASQAIATISVARREDRLVHEHKRRKRAVGALTLEVKTTGDGQASTSAAQQEREAFLLPQIAARKRGILSGDISVFGQRCAFTMAWRATLTTKRAPPKSKPRATRSRQWWSINMTKAMTGSGC